MLDALEDRCLLSSSAWPNWLVAQPPQQTVATLDVSQTLQLRSNPANNTQLAAGVVGSVANHSGTGGVDWYSFTLQQASDIQLTTFDLPGSSHLNSIVSLYNSEAFDPYYPFDFQSPPYDVSHHRLLTQFDATAGGAGATLDRQLAPGTYYVAVSGHGNQFFNPFLAGSGFAGSTGAFRLLLTATPLPLAPGDGPTVLSVHPGLYNGWTNNLVLHASPLAAYIDLSSPIDPGSVVLMQQPGDVANVGLTYNPTGDFGNGDSPVILTGFHYAADSMELQLKFAAPLKPGYYKLTLTGTANPAGAIGGADPQSGNPTSINLGQDATHPSGQDFSTTFQVDGSEGTASAGTAGDDTAATSRNLGDITGRGIIQAGGTIGDDPAYDPSLFSVSAPYLYNAASDVDLYHFHVSGPGVYDFSAEVFAGRIGSTLDAALSLFRVDPYNTTSPLQWVASNDNSGNQTQGTDGNSLPLSTDPILDVNLTAGDYYLAVSSGGQFPNCPDGKSNLPGTNGVFDPNVSHSGYNGTSTGAYVLNLLVQPAVPPPKVVSTSVPRGATLSTAPTQLTVTFDSFVNVIALANEAYAQNTTAPVYFIGRNNQIYFPRLQAYDAATNQATFLILDRLPNQAYTLYLHGLAGHGSVPLVGNDPSGDYVLPFAVSDAAYPADPQNRTQEPSASSSGGQDLGVLFPLELQNTVKLTGVLAASTPETDTYTFELSQTQQYQFTLTSGQGGPLGNVQALIRDAAGVAVQKTLDGSVSSLHAELKPGRYTLVLGRTSTDTTNPAPYQIQISLLNVGQNPPPLPLGPAPFLQIRTLNSTPPVNPPVISVAAASLSQGNNLPISSIPRTELVGGVSAATADSAFALGTTQVRGLSSGTVYTATSLQSLGSAFVSLLFVTSATALEESSTAGLNSLMDSFWASAKVWLDSLMPRLGQFLQPTSPSALTPPTASASEDRTQQAAPPPATVEVLSGPVVTDLLGVEAPTLGALSEGATNETPDEPVTELPITTGMWSSLAWIAIPGGTAVAVVFFRGQLVQARKWYQRLRLSRSLPSKRPG